MKKIGALLTIGLLVVSTLGIAKANPGNSKDESQNLLDVVSIEKGLYNIIYLTSSVGNYKVKIYDATGKIIFFEIIKNQKSFKKAYNFKDLLPGKYTIELVNQHEKIKKDIVYDPMPKIKVDVEGVEDFKHKLIVCGIENQPVYISIRDKNNDLVFREVIEGKGNFSKVYDFSKIGSSEVKFEVSCNNQHITKSSK